jgi:aliphatic nitrilase
VVQAAPVWIDLEGTVANIEEAAKEDAKLIAFPETWIPGYPAYIWVGTPAWAIAKGFVQRNFDNSLSYDSPLAQQRNLL